MTSPTFAELGLIEPLLRALAASDYAAPTPIQSQAIPPLLEGRDLLGIAQTGTGKTAAFALPLLQHLAARTEKARPGQPRALILAPTRELAGQIDESFRTYGRSLNLRQCLVFGGVGYGPQTKVLARGVHILTATPGRLMDLMASGRIDLSACELLVLDEADRMLDMGFHRDVQRIAAELPAKRQSLLFSATMPAAVERLARELLNDPLRIDITPKELAVQRITQRVHHLERLDKRALLLKVLRRPDCRRALVFARTKHGAERLAQNLDQEGISAVSLHGDKSQRERQAALQAFKQNRVWVLVATDIAARGIDVDGITHVINYDLPQDPENYVHRIGRTARAGAEGQAISFCAPAERGLLRALEAFMKQTIEVEGPLPEGTAAKRTAAGDRRPRRPATKARRKQGPAKQDLAKQNFSKQDPVKQDLAKQDRAKQGQTRRRPVKQDPVKQDPAKQDPAKPTKPRSAKKNPGRNARAAARAEREGRIGPEAKLKRRRPPQTRSAA